MKIILLVMCVEKSLSIIYYTFTDINIFLSFYIIFNPGDKKRPLKFYSFRKEKAIHLNIDSLSL